MPATLLIILLLIMLVVGFIGGWIVFDKDIDYYRRDYICLDKREFNPDLIRDWVNGLSILSPRFIYKTGTKKRHLSIVKEGEENNE